MLGRPVTYRLGTPGRHIAMNSLGGSPSCTRSAPIAAQAAMALTELQPPVGRGEKDDAERRSGGQALLIDESYNANPASMRAALGTLGSLEIAAGRRIAVLGDMKELGDAGPELHRRWPRRSRRTASTSSSRQARSCGTSSTRSRRARRRACGHLGRPRRRGRRRVRPGDAVMVKGSLSTRMGLIVEALKQNFGSGIQVQAAKDNSCSSSSPTIARISAR